MKHECRRCGLCCRKGGPALHHDDRWLLEELGLTSMVCLRPGEPAYDPRFEGVRFLQDELIKIRGKDEGWECLHFDSASSGCSIYHCRPTECRALSCSHVQPVLDVINTPTLSRKDYVTEGSALWECICEHEKRFPVSRALEMAQNAAGIVPPRLDVELRAEVAFRRILARHVKASDQDLWAYLGRPLWLVLRPYGTIYLNYRDAD